MINPFVDNALFETLLDLEGDLMLPLAFLILFIIIFLGYALMTYLKLRNKVGKVDEALADLGKLDPVWSKERLLSFINLYTTDLMRAWSSKDRDKLREMVSDDLYSAREKVLDTLDEVRQSNVIEDFRIREVLFVDVQDFTNDEFDRFTARIKYVAINYTKNWRDRWEEPKWDDDADPNPGMTSKEYTEFWTFLRSGDSWKLHRMEKEWKEGNFVATDPLLEDEKYGDVKAK